MGQWPAAGLGALSVAVCAGDFLKEGAIIFIISIIVWAGKAPAYNAGDPGSIPGLGRSSGEGNGIPLQYSCLENPTDGGAW